VTPCFAALSWIPVVASNREPVPQQARCDSPSEEAQSHNAQTFLLNRFACHSGMLTPLRPLCVARHPCEVCGVGRQGPDHCKFVSSPSRISVSRFLFEREERSAAIRVLEQPGVVRGNARRIDQNDFSRHLLIRGSRRDDALSHD
jgi:hypothetical protein